MLSSALVRRSAEPALHHGRLVGGARVGLGPGACRCGGGGIGLLLLLLLLLPIPALPSPSPLLHLSSPPPLLLSSTSPPPTSSPSASSSSSRRPVAPFRASLQAGRESRRLPPPTLPTPSLHASLPPSAALLSAPPLLLPPPPRRLLALPLPACPLLPCSRPPLDLLPGPRLSPLPFRPRHRRSRPRPPAARSPGHLWIPPAPVVPRTLPLLDPP